MQFRLYSDVRIQALFCAFEIDSKQNKQTNKQKQQQNTEKQTLHCAFFLTCTHIIFYLLARVTLFVMPEKEIR